jgi:hypothetical protein
MNQLLGASLILILCPLIGAMLMPPVPKSRRQRTTSPSLKQGWPSWLLRSHSTAIDWAQWGWTLEILQGLIAVGMAKLIFPDYPEWDMIALMGVTAGRFWRQRSARNSPANGGILMMFAGYMLHNPVSGMLVFLFGGIGSMVFRENRQIAFVWLMLMPLIIVIRDPRSGILILLTAGLAGVLYGLEQKQSPAQAKSTAQMFRADALSDRLNPAVAGELAVTLAQLQQQGFPVPIGWVIYPGDDPESLAQMIQPLERQLWTVQLSFVNRSNQQVMGDLIGLRSIWAAIVQGFEAHSGERVAAIVQPQINCLYRGSVYCQAPTLKADIPSPVSQQIIALVDRLNAELNTLETLEWGYDGQQVWILQVQ